MDAPKIQVKCSVGNCQYNEKRMCNAKELEVNALGDGKAMTSEGTSCKTFSNSK